MIKFTMVLIVVTHCLVAGTIGTIYRPTAGRVVYTAATLPPTSAPSSAVFCLDCRRDRSCSAGTVPIRIGAMAFSENGTGDYDCSSGALTTIPDSFIMALKGGVCVGVAGDTSGCTDGQAMRLIGTESKSWPDFWLFFQRTVVNRAINGMRREICRSGLASCESSDRGDFDARDTADTNLRGRDLPAE